MAQVSVCIPVYNRSSALRRTIDSVIAQTHPDWELIVVDDGSTDDSRDIVRGYRDPRIRLVEQANAGCAAARNRGLAEAAGEYVAFLDHDDRWDPGKLALQAAFLREHPECGLVYGRIAFTDEQGAELDEARLPGPEGWVYEDLLTRHNFIFTMSNPMMRAALVREVGGLDPEADISDDWDLFLRLAPLTQFGRIDRVLVRYNVGNSRAQTHDVFRVYRSERSLIRRHLLRDRGLAPPVRRELLESFARRFAPAFREQGWHSLRAGRAGRAWRCYARAIQLCPRYAADPRLLRDLAALAALTLGLRGRGAAG